MSQLTSQLKVAASHRAATRRRGFLALVPQLHPLGRLLRLTVLFHPYRHPRAAVLVLRLPPPGESHDDREGTLLNLRSTVVVEDSFQPL